MIFNLGDTMVYHSLSGYELPQNKIFHHCVSLANLTLCAVEKISPFNIDVKSICLWWS